MEKLSEILPLFWPPRWLQTKNRLTERGSWKTGFCCCSDCLLKCHRLVKKIENSRRDGENNGRFSNFRFPDACKTELRAFREASAFVRVDSEMCWLLAYLDNPVSQLIFLLVIWILIFLIHWMVPTVLYAYMPLKWCRPS